MLTANKHQTELTRSSAVAVIADRTACNSTIITARFLF